MSMLQQDFCEGLGQYDRNAASVNLVSMQFMRDIGVYMQVDTLNYEHQGLLLLTWFNFNPSMDN